MSDKTVRTLTKEIFDQLSKKRDHENLTESQHYCIDQFIATEAFYLAYSTLERLKNECIH